MSNSSSSQSQPAATNSVGPNMTNPATTPAGPPGPAAPGQHLGPTGAGDPHLHSPVAELFNDFGKPLRLTIDEALIRLQYKNSFYATVASGISRRAVNDAVCDTLAVVVNPDTNLGVELIYNPNYFANIRSLSHFEFVLEHELVHLILKHPQRFWEHCLSDTIQGKQNFNIAADFADNSLIVKHFTQDQKMLKELYLFPDKYPEVKMDDEQSFEYYLRTMHSRVKEEQLQEMMKKMVNQHNWDKKVGADGNMEDVNKKDLQKSKVKNDLNFSEYIQNQAERHERQHGVIPGHVRELLKELIQPDVKPNWDDLLRSEVMTGTPVTPERSIHRFSRRLYGVPQATKFPGKKTERGYTIAFIQDTSGSISSEDLKVAAGIVADLKDHRHAVEIFYIQADTDVRFHKKIRDISDFEWHAHGRGGTDFVVPLEWVYENIHPDIVIYFTDGYGTAPFVEPPFKVIWCLPERCQSPAAWGTPITIPYGGNRYY